VSARQAPGFVTKHPAYAATQRRQGAWIVASGAVRMNRMNEVLQIGREA
jgi:hypothetical protein